ncbi:MAG TPA: TadE/TadG family type IV pilus assembly protein [Candidatus Acidoferrales bacterium]|nr:TadE/TadG family type IV pilus assembly protein [Candidatus Acidoferrales bacterium]
MNCTKRIWRPLETSESGPRRRAQFWSDSGQSLVELALLTPLLLLLALGVIEMGRYMYIGIVVGNAARAGASFGVVRPGDGPGITTAACNDFLNNFGGNPTPICDGSTSTTSNHLGVTSTQTCGCDNSGTIATLYTGAAFCDAVPDATMSACTGHWVAMINVQASGKFPALSNYPGIPGSLTLTKTAIMRVND